MTLRVGGRKIKRTRRSANKPARFTSTELRPHPNAGLVEIVVLGGDKDRRYRLAGEVVRDLGLPTRVHAWGVSIFVSDDGEPLTARDEVTRLAAAL